MISRNIDTPHILERFFSYIEIDTQSCEDSPSAPSSSNQYSLAVILVEDLWRLGVRDVYVDDYGDVYASLPANTEGMPSIGLIAHMDTSPDAPGDVKNYRIAHYDGQPVVLNEEKNIVLSADEFPELDKYKGQDIIVTDGTSLLGADDKAGIAAIMSAIEFIQRNRDLKHGKISVAFTPDEEIGRGTDHFIVGQFDVDFAYTIDGGEIGEIEYENFNAASAHVSFVGRSVHPGSAKNKMINASKLAMLFQSMLPASETPETTEGREGFFHLTAMNGCVEHASLDYIIRDHDSILFENRKKLMLEIADKINEKYGDKVCTVELKDQYYNMLQKIEPVMYIVDRAKQAMIDLGIEPKVVPIRGGTDGARLSFMGVPCPNIFAGGVNFHSRFEYLPVESLKAASKVVACLVAQD